MTISDKKKGFDANSDSTVDYYISVVMSANDYYPFGMVAPGRKFSAGNGFRYGFNGQEKSTEIDPNGSSYTAEFWQYDVRIGRRWNVDPVVKEYESPYAAFANNPIWFIDPDGSDTTQRNAGVRIAQEYLDNKKAGNQYLMGAKGKPGEKVDCSGLVAACVTAGGETNPNTGNKGSGVLNIESNTQKVDDKDVVAGNIVTFEFDKGYPYHTGLLTNVVKDKDGIVTSFTMIHSSGGKGPNEQTVTIGEGKLGNGVNGFYKWDTKPDQTNSGKTTSSSRPRLSYQQLMKQVEYLESKGLKNAASLYRADAEKIKPR